MYVLCTKYVLWSSIFGWKGFGGCEGTGSQSNGPAKHTQAAGQRLQRPSGEEMFQRQGLRHAPTASGCVDGGCFEDGECTTPGTAYACGCNRGGGGVVWMLGDGHVMTDRDGHVMEALWYGT